MKEFRWYPVRVRGGREQKIKDQIEDLLKEANRVDLLPNIFVPYQKVYVVKKGKKSIEKRHFGYIVLQGDMDNREICDLVMDVPGVYGFITPEGTGRQYTPMPLNPEEVDNMLGVQVKQDQIQHDIKQNFIVGEKVEIIDGVLKGKTAIIRVVDASRKKVEATIQIFGKETKTEIPFAQVKKI